jgi:hypothetical protein
MSSMWNACKCCKLYCVLHMHRSTDRMNHSTPWLTTRRRTCPICKGDVVRSLARHGSSRARSPSPRTFLSDARQYRRLDRGNHGHNALDSDHDRPFSDEEEDVQTQAATRRNDSPSAAMPIPTSTQAVPADEVYEEDVERGAEGAEDAQGTERPTIWQTVGSWGLPGLGSFGRDSTGQDSRAERDR